MGGAGGIFAGGCSVTGRGTVCDLVTLSKAPSIACLFWGAAGCTALRFSAMTTSAKSSPIADVANIEFAPQLPRSSVLIIVKDVAIFLC